MSEKYFEILGDRSQSGNYIPLGRELPRTPPLVDVRRHLDFSEETLEIVEADQDDQNRTFDAKTSASKTEPDDSMLKGMTGYQLTLSDLDFIKKMKEDKLIKKLQGDLDEVQKLLKTETMALKLTSAARDEAKAALEKLPSCEELTEWVTVVLKMTAPSPEFTDLDPKSLLAMVTTEDVHGALREKQAEIHHLGKMVENKRKKEAKERGELEKQIASEQRKIQELMCRLSDLKSELAQEEAREAAEMQLDAQKKAPEIKPEKQNTSEELQTTKNKAQHPKERKRGVKSAEKSDNEAKQSKSTRTKHADGQSGLRDVQTKRSTSESMNTKQKSGAAARRRPAESTKAAAGGPQRSEEKESNPQEEPAQAARGRRKPPGTTQTAASQAKNQSKVKIRGAESAAPSHSRQTDGAAEEAQNAGLRRSKRIASRR